jgi:CxxC motif-containing protein
MSKKITCIQCPLGCEITVLKKDSEYVAEGQHCSRGETYAIQEATDPQRVLTTAIPIHFGMQKMLPVRSNKQLPKDMIKPGVKKLASIIVEAPVYCGDIIVHEFMDTNVDIIATRDVKRRVK